MSTTPIEQHPAAGDASPVTFRWPRPALAWLWWVPAAIGSLYALMIVISLPTIVDSIWLSSDSDIDGVLAHMGAQAPAGATLTTGDFPHYESMALTLLTRSWPFYREIWQYAPVIFAAVGCAAVIWSVWHSFGRWPASVVAGVLVCFGGGGTATITAGGLATVFAIDAHANTLITAAVCAAALVWTIPRIAEVPVWRLASIAAVIGVLGGLPLAGDKFYWAWGVAPMVVVVALTAWRGPQDRATRVLLFGAGALAAMLLTDAVFTAIMRGAGVRGFSPSLDSYLTFATPVGLAKNFETFLRAMPSLTAGTFFGKAVTTRSEFELVSATLVFAALATVVWSVRRRVANSLPRAVGGGDPVGARFVHTTFWITVICGGSLIFLLGSPNPETTDGRYLLGPYVGVIALLPLLLERGNGWKLVVTAAASVFAFSALYQFNDGVLKQMKIGYQTPSEARAIAAFARTEHVSVGYGGYWNSIDLMWNSDFKVDVYPIQRCASDKHFLCTFGEIAISSWDMPHGNVRSMLIINPKASQVRRREGAFGVPIAAKRIGNLDVYVYPYDIASKLRPERGLTL
jgi:hypothetical protein